MKRLFYVYRKVIFNIPFSKAKCLLSKAPLCEECFGYSIHWPMVGNISLWLSTAEGTMTFYCVAHRLQILESPTSDSRFFYVCRKVIFNMLFSKAERLPNEAPPKRSASLWRVFWLSNTLPNDDAELALWLFSAGYSATAIKPLSYSKWKKVRLEE